MLGRIGWQSASRPSVNERRCKRLEISYDLLEVWLRGNDGHPILPLLTGYATVEGELRVLGIPDDAKVVKVYDIPDQPFVFGVMFHSEEFPLVRHGEQPPLLDLGYEWIPKGEN